MENYVNLLHVLAEFRLADAIEWHDELGNEPNYVRFTVCNSGECCEYTITQTDNNQFQILKTDLDTNNR